MENSTFRINEEFTSGLIPKKPNAAFGSPLPLDPWMTSSVKNTDSTGVTPIAPESCITSYPNLFATPFSHPGNNMSNSYRGFPGVLGNCPKFSDFDPRNSSIATLRMKAKEHCVDKKFWGALPSYICFILKAFIFSFHWELLEVCIIYLYFFFIHSMNLLIKKIYN